MRSSAIEELRSTRTIRARCQELLARAEQGELTHFAVERRRLGEVADMTAELTRKRYPTLEIPPHSRFAHFDVGGVPRLAQLEAALKDYEPKERARTLVDVVVTSVLLDAGAGSGWSYREPDTGLSIGRSEGLAVASLAWVKSGALSSVGKPYQVDAGGLNRVTEGSLGRAFQVSASNPLVGVPGRVHLLRALGAVLTERRDVFGPDARLGGLADYLFSQAEGNELPATAILTTVLDALGSIWPGRLTLAGVPLGDVWRHPKAGGRGEVAQLVPFHKLSQWLSYSLIHALEVSGLRVRGLDELTGLAEYRNGGLFIDTGVLVPKHEGVTEGSHEVGSEVIVEWRALTIALLDELAPLVRQRLGVDAARMPLAQVLEGGTWALGRELARKLREDGGSPIRVLSDGTVF